MYMIITGSGRLGTELAVRFSCQGHDVVMIDSDPAKFEDLGAGFNGKSITGMPFDEDVLQEAGIIHADVVIAVTDDDNVNVMVSQKYFTRCHALSQEYRHLIRCLLSAVWALM